MFCRSVTPNVSNDMELKEVRIVEPTSEPTISSEQDDNNAETSSEANLVSDIDDIIRRRSSSLYAKKSMRKSLRHHSVHHLRNLPVEDLVAGIIDDVAGGSDRTDLVDDGSVVGEKSVAYQQFRYLESKSEIRCLTRSMEDKRRVKELLEEYENRQSTLRPNSLSLKSQVVRIGWHKFWHGSKSEGSKVARVSWFESLEGKLGVGVSSFFRFVHSVILINFSISIVFFLFLALPQITHRWNFQSGENHTRTLGYDVQDAKNISFQGSELLLGNGWFEYTELYYGFYTSDILKMLSLSYDMKFAYFILVSFAFFIVLVVLCTMFSGAFKNSYYNTKGGSMSHVDGSIVFCAWDFNIREAEVARLRSASIHLDLKTLFMELTRKRRVFALSEKMMMMMKMVAVEVFIIAALVASPATLYFASKSTKDNPDSLAFRLGVPVLLTCSNRFLPIIFSHLGKWEEFLSSRKSLYLIVIRTSVLQACNLGMIVYYWFCHLACSADEVKCKSVQCWETFVGTQLYVLVVLDFLLSIITTVLQLIKRCLFRSLGSKIKSKFILSALQSKEFDVGRASINVVYNQCLMWLSMYFSPLLGILIIIKLVALFYLKKLLALAGCYEPVKVWRLGHLTTFIRLIHLVTFLLCLSTFTYIVVYTTPSVDCGPFRNYHHPYEIFGLDAAVEDDSVKHSFRILARDVLSSVGFRAYICIIFGLAVFYVRVLAQGRCYVTTQLKRQIELESRDRCYYMDRLKWSRAYLMQGAPVGQHEIFRRKRPKITDIVESMTPSPQPQKVINEDGRSTIYPMTPLTGPHYLPPENRHLVTNDQFNIMFPNKKAYVESAFQLQQNVEQLHQKDLQQESQPLRQWPDDEVDCLETETVGHGNSHELNRIDHLFNFDDYDDNTVMRHQNPDNGNGDEGHDDDDDDEGGRDDDVEGEGRDGDDGSLEHMMSHYE